MGKDLTGVHAVQRKGPRVIVAAVLADAGLLHALCTLTPVYAQAEGQASSFEVASIRPSHLTPGCFSMLPPGGTHFDLTCVTLRLLIQMAYQTSYVEGDRRTLDSNYDLRATTPDGQLWTMSSVEPMLKQLLIRRFHLVIHAGKHELSGYGMEVARSGSKLQPVAPELVVEGQKSGEPSQNFTYPGRVQGRGVNAKGIAGLLSIAMHVPVVDHTGLTGTFNFNLNYAPDESTDANLPSFFTATEEQLGLKLQPEKVFVDTLFIDHADAAPTPN